MLDLSYIIQDMKTQTNNKTEERKNRFTGQSIMLTKDCLLYTSPSPRDVEESRMPSSA